MYPHRPIAKRYNQLAMIIHHLRTEPEKRITVVYISEDVATSFIAFAEANNVIFETGDLEQYGDMYKQDIISFKVKE